MKLDARTVRRVRLALAVGGAAAFGLAYLLSAGFRSEVDRAAGTLYRGDVAGLRDYILSFGPWAPVVSASLMVFQALAAPLPAFVLAFANGLAFGAFWGGALSLGSATLAAAISFWLARALGRGPVEALVGKAGLESADRWFERWGAYAVLVARLVPVLSFDVISFAAGLTRMRFERFLAATASGAAPATFVYSYLGERPPVRLGPAGGVRDRGGRRTGGRRRPAPKTRAGDRPRYIPLSLPESAAVHKGGTMSDKKHEQRSARTAGGKGRGQRSPDTGQGDFFFEQFRVPRGCLGYVVADPETGLAALIDPELEMVEPMLDAVFEHALRPAYVIDTHTHADHVSGARELASKTVAKVVMHEKAPASSVDVRVEDGDRLHLGELSLKFLHTPGHAKDLVSVVLPDRILSADALLMGSCGRTDLPNGNATQQYHTLYHTYKSLPDGLLIYPGHDYAGRSHSFLGEEKKDNPKMLYASEEEFVEFMDLENPRHLDPVSRLADALKSNMA